MNNEIKILIADDHPIFRAGLRQVIERNPQFRVVAEAEDGGAALELLANCGAEIALLDVDMPHKDGFEVARTAQEKCLPVSIVFLTMHKDERLLNAALDLGVKGYLVKESAAAELTNCLKAVADGMEFVSPQLTGFLLKRSRRAQSLIEQQPGISALTPTEQRVLRLVARYKTSREIADELFISVRTVEFHRAKICEKLNLKGAHALVKFAARNFSEL